jgi:hypothetical protein
MRIATDLNLAMGRGKKQFQRQPFGRRLVARFLLGQGDEWLGWRGLR